MMNKIFTALITTGVLFALLCGRIENVSAAMLEQCSAAVTLSFSLMGSFCLWSGIMRLAEKSGLSNLLANALSPILRRLFHELDPNRPAMQAISMNIAANLLGLGNAATPLGIAAMQHMQAEQKSKAKATDSMALFVVMNTASLQLIPTTTAILRSAAGAKQPLDILPAVWAASAVSVIFGIAAAKILEKGRND